MSRETREPMAHTSSKSPREVERLDRLLDRCLEDTFPASDPVSSLSTRPNCTTRQV
jgi:hypothetical protein